MLNCVKRLWLPMVLIAAASAILLLSDFNRRNRTSEAKSKAFPEIAIMQFTSTPLLDAHVAGIKEGLHKKGVLADNEHNLRLFNPQGDFPTANAIAQQMVHGNYDLLITSSTVALQITAKANLSTQVPHIFGAVTSPQGAGVGITGPEADQHPAWLTGIGTFQPVQRAFEIAHQLNPSLQRIGVVWNPGEQCSEACTAEAKIACARLGIELVEAVATQSGEINDAIHSLLGKNVEAVWIGGDTTANAAAAMIIHIAAAQQIPVFTNDPTDVGKGALFGLGADYHTVGLYTADLAAEILNGRAVNSFRIDNVVPEQFSLNESVLASLPSKWTLVDSLKKRIIE
jgi:ABC-type uncharacterized transport system substrate-binding protein